MVRRVVICGGRDAADVAAAIQALEALHEELGFDVVIGGDARGIDKIAAAWALEKGLELVEFPADWEELGRRAGPLRNQQMLDEAKPDMVIAFPGGKGTADMVRRARAEGLAVRRVDGVF